MCEQQETFYSEVIVSPMEKIKRIPLKEEKTYHNTFGSSFGGENQHVSTA